MTGESPRGPVFAPVDPLLTRPPLTRTPVDPSWPSPAPTWQHPVHPASAWSAYGEYDPFRGTWGPERREPWSRRKRATVIGVVASVTALVVALVGTGVVVLLASERERERQQAAVSAALDAALPSLEAFVARDTGRTWKAPVAARVLDDADFVAALEASPGDLPHEPSGDADDTGVTVTAMGLAPDPTAYWDASRSGVTDNVVGFYDDHAKTLYVRGSTWGPAVEDTVVHELAHANQDQAFGLTTLMEATSSSNESPDVLQSVIEGEAMLVEHDYGATRTQAWRDAVDADLSGGTTGDVKLADAQAVFPYVQGETFVRALREKGGATAVDAAFTHPPVFSRDLADPLGWLAGRLPRVPRTPRPFAPDGATADVQDYGVLGVRWLWLAVDASRPDLASSSEPQLSALSGWDGDSYVATETASDTSDSSRWCFVDDMRFVDAASRTRALGFIAPWTSAQHVDVSLQGPSSVRLSACRT